MEEKRAHWHFMGKLRPYQQRVMDEASRFLQDGKLHCVAPPGAGKTILGLELAASLGHNTLVLTPTLAIKAQWIERFRQWFRASGDQQPTEENYASSFHDLEKRPFLTTATYQSLHAAYSRTVDEESGEENAGFVLVDELLAAGVRTICLDEAHHLRAEWHRALEGTIQHMAKTLGSELRIISFTATPPYDSTPSEWSRYIDLCGDIDEEIFIPELVATGDLCPHQDFIYLNSPSEEERQHIHAYDERIGEVLRALGERGTLRSVMSIPLFSGNQDYLDEAFDDEELFCEFLGLMSWVGAPIPQDIMAIIGRLKERFSPELALQFLLNHPHFFQEEDVAAIHSELEKARLIQENTILTAPRMRLQKMLVSSTGKIHSAAHIAEHEYAHMGEKLRLLVLVDHIAAAEIPVIGTKEPLVKLGAVPVYEAIRRRVPSMRSVLLTGSLVIIPSALYDDLATLIPQGSTIRISRELPGNCRIVNFSGGTSQAVQVVTQAFENGSVECLVGTAALLGEGWDSPCVNTLVLATTVKAFMLTNQMRGRALRKDPTDPQKVANIWHLATCEPQKFSPQMRTSTSRGDIFSFDIHQLSKRMETFVGPHYVEDRITNGIDRLLPPVNGMRAEKYAERVRTLALQESADRPGTASRWKRCLAGGNYPSAHPYEFQFSTSILPGITTRFSAYAEILFFALLSALILLGSSLARSSAYVGSISFGLLGLGLVVGGIGIHHSLRIRGLTQPLQRTTACAQALLATLAQLGHITSQTTVCVSADTPGEISVALSGGTRAEKQLFSTAFGQLNGPITRPRYVLIPRGRILMGLRMFYAFAVPDCVGVKAEYVAVLCEELDKRGIRTQKVYTRTPEGRAILLKTRKRSAANIAHSAVTFSQRYVESVQ